MIRLIGYLFGLASVLALGLGRLTGVAGATERVLDQLVEVLRLQRAKVNRGDMGARLADLLDLLVGVLA